MTEIKTTRQLNHDWFTTVLINEDDRMHSYQMSIPAKPLEDDTTLGWVMIYGNPDKGQRMAAQSIMSSFEYLLSGSINQTEAINRLRCLRREHKKLYS